MRPDDRSRPRLSQDRRLPRRVSSSPGVAIRQERDIQRHLDLCPRLDLLAHFLIHRDVDVAVQVPQAHARHQFLDSRELLRAVEPPITVPLVDHVVMFGVQPAADLRVPAEVVHHDVIVPAPIDVARAALVAPDVAALAVEQRLAVLGAAADEVPFRARAGVPADLVQVLGPLVARQVGVPTVDVRQRRGRSCRGSCPRRAGWGRAPWPAGHGRDPCLRLGQVALVALCGQAPGLVEGHPSEDGRMIEVPLDHAAQRDLGLAAHVLVGLAPTVGHVRHDQHAQPVRPVELARDVDLDVDAAGR